MGSQQSKDGPPFCSVRPPRMCSVRPPRQVDKDFRIDYLTPRNTEVMRPPKQQRQDFYGKHGDDPPMLAAKPCNNHNEKPVVHQQRVRESGMQQQKQEESVDIKLKTSKIIQVELEVKNAEEGGKATVFEGVFGDITPLTDGFVDYTDIVGNDFHEVYDPEKIQKIFPMGISLGGLSKSLWFKHVEERDACYDAMTGNLPPSYATVMVNPEYYNVPVKAPPSYATVMVNPEYYNVPVKAILSRKEEANNSGKVFHGIQGNDVVVHKDNHVEYSGFDGGKHCVIYDRHKIEKCYPHGICFGGLNRTIWLKDQMERDLCYILMQVIGEVTGKDEEKTYAGLCGSVVLRAGHEVNFSSLAGKRISAASYDPNRIYQVFPMGITGGGVSGTIWFKEMEEMENCFEAMKQKCLR